MTSRKESLNGIHSVVRLNPEEYEVRDIMYKLGYRVEKRGFTILEQLGRLMSNPKVVIKEIVTAAPNPSRTITQLVPKLRHH